MDDDEDCAGSPAAAAAGGVGGVFSTRRQSVFGFNLIHNADVLRHGGCVSSLARNYFAI